MEGARFDLRVCSLMPFRIDVVLLLHFESGDAVCHAQAAEIGIGQGEILGIVGWLQTVLACLAPLIFQSVYAGPLRLWLLMQAIIFKVV
jgi:hypothetical protein